SEKECLVADEQIKAFHEQINQTSQEKELKTKEYQEAQLGLPEEFQTMELKQIGVELEQMKVNSAEKLKAIEDWEKKQGDYQVEIQKIKDQISKDRMIENGIIAGLKVNRENREQFEKALKAALAKHQEIQKEHLDFLRTHQIESAAAELNRLAVNDRKMGLLQKQMEQNQQALNKKRNQLEQRKEGLQALNSEYIKVEAEWENLSKQVNEREEKLRELAGHDPIEEQIARIDNRLEGYQRLEKQYQESLKNKEKQYHELTANQSLLTNQRNIYSDSLKGEESRLQKNLLEKGFNDSDEAQGSILPKDRQKVLHDKITEFEQAVTNIQAQKTLLQKKLDSRKINEEEWDHLSTHYHQMTALKEECVSRSEVEKNNFNILKDKHDKWVVLSSIYNELTNKQGLYDQIQKLLRADRGRDNSFIDFIAEERLRYVAAKASETLGVMTKYKYALELDTNAGFIIRDNANGGVHRMVSSLSGGETFLTSLSLALALSDQIQLKGQSPLEFFFLDEGFGTLDYNLLDTVIDSLERLSKKERVIGIISHVPDLRERIAKRLIVDPPSSQGDGSRVRIEKA
ncbi:MAG: SbcC/MukB-like Walker B domain-containing protein, partial [Desulfitobacterium hafniense]|nr:SbcC/MukB-like Walker B domain-containing protein [Desulfitobacterium hafniense]